MALVQGHFDSRFEELRQLFESFLESGDELGASICVNIDGKNVVDCWGGFTDTARSRHWEQNSIANVFSTTKTISALLCLLLDSRGLINLDEPVCRYWSEFGAEGKENITVRHVISHTSGLSGWASPVTIEDLCEDFDGSAAKLAAQAPWWEPGTASGYHSLTMGFLVGKLVRCTTGKTAKEFLVDELTVPLDADFQLGARKTDWDRISDIVPPVFKAAPEMSHSVTSSTTQSQTKQTAQQNIASKTMLNPTVHASIANTAMWRLAELGAANGHGHARSIVRLLSLITLNGFDENTGRQYLSQQTIDKIFDQQADGRDLVVNQRLRFGTGFGLTGAHTEVQWLPQGRVCFWGGWGGSMAVMDLDRRITFSYVMNKMDNIGLGSTRTKAYVKAVYDAIT